MNSRTDTIRRTCPSCGRMMTLLQRRRKGEYDLNPPWRFVRHNIRPSARDALCNASYSRLEGQPGAYNAKRKVLADAQ